MDILQQEKFPISLLLRKDLPFAVYRLPDSKEILAVVQINRELTLVDTENLDEEKGFAIADFKSFKTCKFFLIKPDFIVEKGQVVDGMVSQISLLPDAENLFQENSVVGKEGYFAMADKTLDSLKSGNLKKVVLSRVIAADLRDNFRIEIFFRALEKQYSTAFVYLFNLPGIGTWVGATPEVLLRINENYAETVSLAGTRPADKTDWTQKEMEEQQIVTDFIAEKLKETGITGFVQKGVTTVQAGNLAHLKTVFQIERSEIISKVGKLVRQLHPTPAICGSPRETAYQFILATETHERRFYTGFLGPMNLLGTLDLFVNLRCAEIGKRKMNVYVGGGLTASSVTMDEWQETERKSRTLMAVAENLQTFVP